MNSKINSQKNQTQIRFWQPESANITSELVYGANEEGRAIPAEPEAPANLLEAVDICRAAIEAFITVRLI
ncbi:hypothetical protein DPMN_009607 [Dreissena polymorpha]|uniref:Uncharacterized protein n=1 Tax=Dreissena polymorpha TaxID=45954 RepID=A0A9D4N2H9_DREPO|nr:hypothetical protein DPMN_009607 [Dreissena polymorpha]